MVFFFLQYLDSIFWNLWNIFEASTVHVCMANALTRVFPTPQFTSGKNCFQRQVRYTCWLLASGQALRLKFWTFPLKSPKSGVVCFKKKFTQVWNIIKIQFLKDASYFVQSHKISTVFICCLLLETLIFCVIYFLNSSQSFLNFHFW